MLRRFRSRAQSLASVCALVASVGANAVGASTHAHTGLDAPAYVEHDASAHRVGGAGSTAPLPQPQCLVCQWARSGWAPPVRVSHHAPPLDAVRRALVDGFAAMSRARAAQPPLRGPPSLI